MYKSISIIFIILVLGTLGAEATDVSPRHVKMALTKVSDQMKVTWTTVDRPRSPTVLYSHEFFKPDLINGSVSPVFSAKGSYETFDTLHWSGHSNQATMENLNPYTTYFYYAGDKESNVWSQCFNFSTRGFNTPEFKFAVYGDMGSGGQDMDHSDKYTLAGIAQRQSELDFVLHVGDIAYADLTKDSRVFGNETVWNQFLDDIEPLSTTLPYMVCPGNHDIFFDLAIYRKTFAMPAEAESHSWYSFDFGQVHFLGFSSEHNFLPLSEQHTWIENDLKQYRAKNPNGWLVAYSHRPFYCSVQWGWCENSELRKLMTESLEQLFYKYNVDVYLAGHTHSYERTLPVFNGQVYGTYDSPKAPVHITVGTGGNAEGPDHDFLPTPVWSNGPRYDHTGFGTLTFINSTTVQWDFIGNPTNSIIDTIFINKGSF